MIAAPQYNLLIILHLKTAEIFTGRLILLGNVTLHFPITIKTYRIPFNFVRVAQTKSCFSHITPLPKLTPQGHRVTIHRFNSIPLEDFDPVALYKLIYMKADIRMVEETLISGDVFVFDALHLNLSHIAKLTSPLTKNALLCAQV